MSRILFAWELGGGMGHLARLQPIAAELMSRGHHIEMAACNLDIARRQIGTTGVRFLQAPNWKPSQHSRQLTVRTFAHILHNVGYADHERLTAQLRTWRMLLETAKPEILVCDASPTALLAARGLGLRVVVIDAGFHLPPSIYPLPSYRFIGRPIDVETNKAFEDKLTKDINVALAVLGISQIDCIGELFKTDLAVLTTVAELDHVDDRPTPNYCGPFLQFAGDEPDWPSGNGPHVFAYVKNFPLITELLDELQRRALPTLIYSPDIPPNIRKRYDGAIRFHDAPVSMAYAARVCGIMISHAGYGLPFDSLTAGKPLMSLPIYLDQHIVAKCVETIGAGAYFTPGGKRSIAGVLEQTLACGKGAAEFADKYGRLDRAAETKRISELVCG